MKNPKTRKAGIDRQRDESLIQKRVFALGHFLIILFSVWLIFMKGWTILGDLFGKDWSFADQNRATVLLAVAFFYWLRHLVTLFYLLKRKVEWGEVFGLLFFIAFVEIGLLLIGGGAFRNYAIRLGKLDALALILLLLGSYLNSFSEIQRKKWKANSTNKGHCYTEGLFRYSMHMNYFGDVVLFTGWCLFTYNYWTLLLPLFMLLSFIYAHIPGLDSYLAERYGEEFEHYAKKTKKIIPFIY